MDQQRLSGTRYLVSVVAIAALYVAAARFSFDLATQAGNIAPVWLASGIALAALLVFGIRLWPAVAIGALVAYLMTPVPTLAAVAPAIGNTLAAVAGASLLGRARFDMSLARIRDVLALVGLGALVSSTISATVGVAALSLTGAVDAGQVPKLWLLWWLGNVTGDLLVIPLVLAMRQRRTFRLNALRVLELVSIFTLAVAAGILVFASTPADALTGGLVLFPFVLFPFLVWAALRFGIQGTTTLSVVLSGIAVWGSARGLGPFSTDLAQTFLTTQVFMAVIATTALLLAVVVAERTQAMGALGRAESAHRAQLDRLTFAVPDGITIQATDGRIVYANLAAAQLSGYQSIEEFIDAPSTDFADRFALHSEEGHQFPFADLPGRRALDGEHPGEAVLRVRDRSSGEEFWHLLTSTPVFNDAGEVEFAVNVFRDVTEQKDAELAQGFLLEATKVLTSSLNYRITMQRLANLVVPTLADWSSIDVLEDGVIDQLAVAHTDPEKARWARESRAANPPTLDDPNGVAAVIKTGQPQIIRDIPQSDLEASITDPVVREQILELRLRSLMILPLRARGKTFGALSMMQAESERVYDEHDLALAEELAARAGNAIDNARLYRERNTIARTLQQSLLPPSLPDIPELDLAAKFWASGEGNDVGGDFYDVFATSDGDWAIGIGDVCGKGPEAAALMGLVRHTVRAAAIRTDQPSEVLRVVNTAVLAQAAEDRFCTSCFVRVRANGGGCHLTVACAGHPLPLVLRANGEVHAVGVPGSLLGIFETTELVDTRVDLAAGESLLLFTDGLTEAQREGERFGDDRLMALFATCIGLDATSSAARIEEAFLDFVPEAPRDDVAFVILQVRERSGT